MQEYTWRPPGKEKSHDGCPVEIRCVVGRQGCVVFYFLPLSKEKQRHGVNTSGLGQDENSCGLSIPPCHRREETQRMSLRPKVSKNQKATRNRCTLLHTLLSDSPTTKQEPPARQLLGHLISTPHDITTTKREAFAQS
jgi:hypothetical protein